MGPGFRRGDTEFLVDAVAGRQGDTEGLEA